MTTQAPAPLAYTLLASRYIADAAEYGTRFGDRKVFLSTVPGIELWDTDCCAVLEELRRAGLLDLARADLVAAMDPALVQASEWRLDNITTWHFLVLPDHLARW